MADLSITGEVVVTSEKAEGAFDRVGAKAGQMASKVQTEANKASSAIDGIGTGAETGAEKFTRAESRMRAAIQKSTRELEMLGKTASQKFEAQIDFKGLDKAKFQPVLDDLRKMEEATKRAETGFSGMGTAAQMAGRALAAIGIGASVREFVTMADASTNMASKLALVTGSAAELAQVQRRLFDVAQASRVGFVGLADTYTQFARSTKDLGVSQTALLDITKTISQAITISGGSAASAQAALVQLGQGFASGALRGEELNSVLEQTPRLAQAIADGLGVGIGKLREMGSNGELTAEKVLGALQKAAAGIESEFARMTPTIEQSITKITNSMTRLVGEIDKGVGATAKLSSALGLVSGGIDFLAGDISKLNSQGALRAAADEVLRLDGMAKRLRNTMDSGIVGPNAQANLDALMVKLAEAKARFRELDAQLGGSGKDPRDQSGYTTRSQSYANEAKRLEGVQAAMGKVLGNLSGVKDSFFKDLNALYAGYQNGLIKTAEYQQAVANLIRDSGSNKPSAGGKGGDQFAAERDAAKEWARYMKDFSKAAQDASAESDSLTKSQEKLIEFLQSPAYQNASEPMRQLALQSAYAAINQEQANVATKEAAKAAAESAKALSAWAEVRAKESQGLQNQINARREEVTLMGMTTEAVVAYTQAKYEQQAAEKEAYAAALESASFYAGEYADAYKTAAEAARQQAAQLRELGGLEVEKANREAAKKAADEWERAADDINRSLTDALLRGFESGKGFAENLRDTLKNMFSTLVLRPIISAAMSPVAGAINGMLYGNTAAAAGGGANALGMIGSGANLINGLQGTQGVLGTVGGWLGMNTVAANTALASTIGIDAASAAAAANAASAAGSGLMGTIGAAMPWIAGAAAIMAIVSSLDDSGTYHTGGAAQYSGARGLMSGQDATGYNIGFGRVEAGAQTISAVGGIAQALGTALDGVAVAFGQRAGYEVATAFADDSSKDGAWGALRISREGQELLNWQDTRTSRWAPKEFGDGEAGYKEYLAAVAKDTRQVLLDMDLPSWADKMLNSIGESASMEQLSATVQQIAAIKTQFVQLGKAMEMFDGISSGMESALLSAAGSIDALTASAAGYYDAVYTEQEKIARARTQLETTLAGYGQSLPATREQYRALVEQQMAAGESGAEFAVVLMGLAGTFAQVADDIDAQFAEMGKSASEVFEKLLADIGRVRGDVAGTRADMLASSQGMTPAQIAAAVNAAMVYAPNTAGVVGAQGGVAAAAAQVAASKAAADAAQAAASGLYGGLQGSISARDAAASEQARLVAAIAAARANYAKFQDGGEFRNYSYSNRVRNMGIFAAEIQSAQQQLDALQPSLDSYNAAVAAQQAVYDAAQGAANGYAQQLAAAQAALATAQQAEVQARADYAAQLNTFVLAASNSVGKLSSLREEVVRYYEEQAQAVQTLLDQIGGVQSGVRGAQASILKPERIDYAALAVAVQQAMGAAASSTYAGSTTASQDLERMSALQGDVLAYYEQQKQAVAAMLATAKNLRGVIDDVRASTFTAQQGAAALAENYSRSYAMALSTTGAVRDGYVREMADGLPALANSIKEQATSRAEWQIEVGRVLAQANSAAGLLEADAGADGYAAQSLALLASMDAALSGMSARVESDTSYLSTSLGLLGSIDTALAQLEGSTKSAEQVIAQAIHDGTAAQLTGLRAIVAALRGESVPAFATGGSFGGGLRLVGENGPELEVTGPSRIYSASQTAAMLSGGGNANAALVAELRALRADNQAQAAAMVNMQRELNKLMLRWDSQGMPEERIG